MFSALLYCTMPCYDMHPPFRTVRGEGEGGSVTDGSGGASVKKKRYVLLVTRIGDRRMKCSQSPEQLYCLIINKASSLEIGRSRHECGPRRKVTASIERTHGFDQGAVGWCLLYAWVVSHLLLVAQRKGFGILQGMPLLCMPCFITFWGGREQHDTLSDSPPDTLMGGSPFYHFFEKLSCPHRVYGTAMLDLLLGR